MAMSEGARRMCLLADIDGYAQLPPVAQSGLTLRLKAVIGVVLKTAGVEAGEVWRQDRLFRQVALLPVAADAGSVVPLLARSLLAELARDQTTAAAGADPDADATPLRVRAAVTRDAVTRVKGGYAGRALATATRLAESPAARAELTANPVALLALILSDGVYQDVLAAGRGDFTLDAFHQVSVDVPAQGWQGTGWILGCAPGSLTPPPRRLGTTLRRNFLPLLAGGADDVVDFLEGATGTNGETGGEEAASAGDHLAADHGGAEHGATDHGGADHADHDSVEIADLNAADAHYYIDQTHTYSFENNGAVEEYTTGSVYDGTEYEAHDAVGDVQDDIV